MEPPKILIVDDRPDKLLALRATIEALPVEIVTASSGEEALRLLLHHSFAILLLDLNMPGLNGLETARLIRERKQLDDLAIIFVSAGDPSEREIEDAFALGAVEFVCPPSPKVLVAKVNVFLELHRERALLREAKSQLEEILEQRTQALMHETRVRRRAEDKLHVFIQKALEYALIMLEPEGIVTEWSPGAERIFQYSQEEAVGKNIAFIFTEEDQKAGVDQAEVAKALQNVQANDERWHRRKDGTTFWASGVLVALHDDQQNLLGFAKLVRDMTPHKLIQERLANINQELEKRVAERTEALQAATRRMENFCYTIAHDLRAPLRAIAGFADLFQDDENINRTEVQEYVERIVESAKRMDMLIQDLLQYARISQMETPLEQVSLSELVQTVLQRMQRRIKECGGRIEITEPLPAVRCNAPTVAQVVENLIDNGLKFVKPGTRPAIRLRSEERQGTVRLWIEDNGIGIAPEHQEQIFQIFQRLHTTTEYEGTGLGLAIVRKAMENIGGQAGVMSEPGQGSKFWLEFPSHSKGPSTHDLTERS